MTTPNMNLPQWPSGALNPSIAYNDAVQLLDALIRPGGIVQDTELSTPPSVTPDDVGMTWVVADSATGGWAGHEDEIALLVADELWTFITPKEGWLVKSLADGKEYEYAESDGWVESAGGGDDPNTVTALATSGSVTVDCALGDYFTCALTGNITSISFTNLPGSGKGATKMIKFTQDSTARSVTWPASFRWAGGTPGVLSTGSGDVDLLAITTFDNGTTWHATLAKDFS